jgi:hypothetical protein
LLSIKLLVRTGSTVDRHPEIGRARVYVDRHCLPRRPDAERAIVDDVDRARYEIFHRHNTSSGKDRRKERRFGGGDQRGYIDCVVTQCIGVGKKAHRTVFRTESDAGQESISCSVFVNEMMQFFFLQCQLVYDRLMDYQKARLTAGVGLKILLLPGWTGG